VAADPGTGGLVTVRDHEIDFVPGGGSPVENVGTIGTPLTPGEEITQDQILEVRAFRVIELRQVASETGVRPGTSRGGEEQRDRSQQHQPLVQLFVAAIRHPRES
jgi:hypothetical protein